MNSCFEKFGCGGEERVRVVIWEGFEVRFFVFFEVEDVGVYLNLLYSDVR